MRFNHAVRFSWQAQYLLKVECDFSWQAQHFVKFLEIAGARKVVVFHTKCASKMGRVRSAERRALNQPHDKTGHISTTAHHDHGTAEGSLTAKT